MSSPSTTGKTLGEENISLVYPQPHRGTVRAIQRQQRVSDELRAIMGPLPMWRALEIFSASEGRSTRTIENDLKTIVGRGDARWIWQKDSAHADRPVRYVRWNA